ncbi:hypothetical protein CKO11_02325 [Rhodobacter sp. TJ_12]|uniref:DUF2255 family protein n=1 Tax=Rhodobacter sp. TJ_12 TaxID=2029399 RepID=UPI001CBEAB76|nr:DUF2255 family protein [Rhodobacter sp. TJ_12]MBZ4021298.1 hypothetical protein [Rhodobacter sp. TJ_12]
MSKLWSAEEQAQIAGTESFRIAPYRADGKTPGTPTYIWFVQVQGRLFVRAYSGQSSSWFQAGLAQRAGQMVLDGKAVDVTFAPVDPTLTDPIDAAYRAKYTTSRYLAPMISARAQAATLEVLPRA